MPTRSAPSPDVEAALRYRVLWKTGQIRPPCWGDTEWLSHTGFQPPRPLRASCVSFTGPRCRKGLSIPLIYGSGDASFLFSRPAGNFPKVTVPSTEPL